MMSEHKIAVAENPLQEEIKKFIFGNYKDIQISDVQMAMALKLAQEYNLSPLRREIHFLPFKNSKGQQDLQPVIAYTEYLKKAQATGYLDGRKYEYGKDDKDVSCTVTIYRKDWKYPLEHTVRYKEIVQKTRDETIQKNIPNKNRTNKPRFMMMKVAIAQGMRLAFPEEVGAMPYEEAEARNVVEGKTEQKATAASIVEETEPTGLPDANDPRIQAISHSERLKNLHRKRVSKMGIEKNELLTRWYQIKYGHPTADFLTDDQIGEIIFTIQDYTPQHLEAFINNLINKNEVSSDQQGS